MMRLALLLMAVAILGAEPHRVVLVQELIRLEAMEKKTVVMFPLEQQGAQIEVKFNSKHGGEGVRTAVYAKGSSQALAGTTYDVAGALKIPLEREKEYRVEVENLRQRLGHALIDVEVTLVFGARSAAAPPAAAAVLDPARKRATIAASLALFAMIFAYSAVRLTPPLLQRWREEK
jgi:hypothetical protein